MTNQEAFESARAGDWIAESFLRTGDVFTITGKSTGYSSFADCLTDGQSVFYAAFDENDNREAGLAVWDAGARTLTPVEIHATLRNGAFIKGDPDPVPFGDGGTITGTFNATAFNAMWSHVWEKGNPHETEAKDIEQDNTNLLGDNVQEALDKVADFILTGEIDGGIDIDIGDLDGPLVEAIVFQDREEPQKVISEFSFEKAGDNPLTMKDTGMYAGTEYVRNKSNVWEVDPSLSVTNDISAGGNLSVEGTTDLKGDVSVNGNITIEGGGTIIDPDGKPIGGGAAGTHIGISPPTEPEQGQFWLDISGEAVMWIYDDGKWLQHPSAGGGVTEDASIEDGTAENQLAHWEGTEGKWVPVIDCSLSDAGRLGLGVTSARTTLHLNDSRPEITFENGNGDSSRIGMSDVSGLLEASDNLTVYGDVTANNFIGDGSQLTNVTEDAPDDGNLYVRRNGAWEIYTPSSTGVLGGAMELVVQPPQAGEFSLSPDAANCYRKANNSGKAVFTVPDGYVFILANVKIYGGSMQVNTIVVDGITPWASSSGQMASSTPLFSSYDGLNAQPVLVRNGMEFTQSGGSNLDLFGFMVPEETALRDALRDKAPTTLEVSDD